MSRLIASVLSFVLLLAAAASSDAQLTRQPPTPVQRAYAAKLGWQPAADKIGEALRASYQPGRSGVAGSVGSTGFQSWLLLYRWCELLARKEPDELARFLGRFFLLDPKSSRASGITFVRPGEAPPEDFQILPFAQLQALVADKDALRAAVSPLLPSGFEPGGGTIAEGLRPDFLAAMAGDEEFLRTFFANLTAKDFPPTALKILQDIWAAERPKWTDYRNLAVAIALVRDQKPPADWPHHQVRPADVPLGNAAPLDEFRFWVASNEKRVLYTDLRRLGPEELKFVVDAPVVASELEWAQKNVRFPRANFGRAFSSIPYRADRLVTRAYTWNDGPYTLAAIQEKGGICVDQAYFAMLSSKAHGMPTLYFEGEGSDGGHAWFGYMKAENRWDMDCGRYINQNYAVGEALDPQTWLPINDHELGALAQSFRHTPSYLASQADLVMAQLFESRGDTSRAQAAFDSAISVSPQNDLAWAAKEAFLDRSHATVAARQKFHEDAIKQFENNQDLKVSHQRALASLARDAGDEVSARAVESKIISQNRRGRSDLSVGVAAGQLAALVDAKKFDDAMKEYRNLLGRLAGNGGGNFFYEIVQPFARSLAINGQGASARRAVELARTAMRPESGSILDQDLASLSSSLGESAGTGR